MHFLFSTPKSTFRHFFNLANSHSLFKTDSSVKSIVSLHSYASLGCLKPSFTHNIQVGIRGLAYPGAFAPTLAIMARVPSIRLHDGGQPGESCPGPVSPSSHSVQTGWHSQKPEQSGPFCSHALVTDHHGKNEQYSLPDVRPRQGSICVRIFFFLGSHKPSAALWELPMLPSVLLLLPAPWGSRFASILTVLSRPDCRTCHLPSGFSQPASYLVNMHMGVGHDTVLGFVKLDRKEGCEDSDSHGASALPSPLWDYQ